MFGIDETSRFRRALPRRLVGGLLAMLVAVVVAGCAGVDEAPPAADLAHAAGSSEGLRQPGEALLIPSPIPGLSMHATLFRPPGPGPFPLAVINHGSEEDAGERAAMPMPSFDTLTAWFLARGYAVLLPQRPGHGETGGAYLETQGNCDSADYVKAGNATADSIAAAIRAMAGQAFIKPTGVVVVGNSAGGWGALALAARNPPAVRAFVSFAGGRGGRRNGFADNVCSEDRLVAAAGTFGRTARLPTLWLYAENDTYFAPALSRRMADAFRAAGGKVEYDLLPAVVGEGHGLIQTSGAAATWEPYLETFLAGGGH